MAQDYTIAWVGNKTRDWHHDQHGDFRDYTVALEDREGTLKVTQKHDTAAPTVGQVVFGYIESEVVTPSDGGEPWTAYKLKKQSRPDNPAAGSTGGGGGSRTPATAPAGSSWSDEKDERIELQGWAQAILQVGNRGATEENIERAIELAQFASVTLRARLGGVKVEPQAEPKTDPEPEPSLVPESDDHPF